MFIVCFVVLEEGCGVDVDVSASPKDQTDPWNNKMFIKTKGGIHENRETEGSKMLLFSCSVAFSFPFN